MHFYIDIVKLDTTDVIACRDSYSGYVWLTPISSHKSVDVVDALKYIFTISLIPDKIKCDNEMYLHAWTHWRVTRAFSTQIGSGELLTREGL